ncbi:hypothetical protein [Merismopedia glauca]|uniref:Uncharacterized protein n=1 Tax=Merismopedia glauca CCAP 1448/3 TaxID=1296344 RepID=A0A2T1C3D4_9CYAN|nr:hypothetical protein [Merismopedia glauca]PSB02771.1 hypothetical protein C7B64_11505 [Merismopedia glauca CCAP 1448/3]
MATAFYSCLGETRPINLLKEYLDIFRGRQKSKAYLLSWLDNWLFRKKKAGLVPWVYVVLQDVADELGYCRDTVHRHLQELMELGLISRRPYHRYPTDNIWEYTINFEELRLLEVKSQERRDISRLYPVKSEDGRDAIYPVCTGVSENQALSPQSSSSLLPSASSLALKGRLRQLPSPNSSPSLISDSQESEIRLPTVQVQNTYTIPTPISSLQTRQTPIPVVVAEKKAEKKEEVSQEETVEQISREDLALSLLQLPVKIKPNSNIKLEVETNFPRLGEALQNLKQAMNSWRVRPDFNWGGLFVKFLRGQGYLEETPIPFNYEEVDPPSADDLRALDAAMASGAIADYYYSTIERSHQVIGEQGNRSVHWRSGLAIVKKAEGSWRSRPFRAREEAGGLVKENQENAVTPGIYVPDPLMSQTLTPTLEELVERKRCQWQDAPLLRSSIAQWAKETEGVILTDTGPVLEEWHDF